MSGNQKKWPSPASPSAKAGFGGKGHSKASPHRHADSGSGPDLVCAPYNFVPLNRAVFIPEWAGQVSHDLPFRDGYCGHVDFRVVARSPLLVGGQQGAAAGNGPNTVRPFQLPDGRCAIPGSSLKGLLRSVVEIAGFGRMRMLDDRRPALRDISGPKVSASYTGRVRDQVKTGWLRRRDGKVEVTPCSMVRLDHDDLCPALGLGAPPKDLFEARRPLNQKYHRWRELCRRAQKDSERIRFDIEKGQAMKRPDRAVNLWSGKNEGRPVFTGQVSRATDVKAGKRTGKHYDFVFFDPRPEQAFEVPDTDWRDFLAIHGDDERDSSTGPTTASIRLSRDIHGDDERDSSTGGMSWPSQWKRAFRKGEDVPVFYLREGPRVILGLAYMPRLAGDYSTLDLVAEACAEHRNPPGLQHGYDLADLLFGAINGERQDDALRGRVSLLAAVAEGRPQPHAQPATILNGPKPSYFPNYLVQPVQPPGKPQATVKQYATYVRHGNGKPQLRGYKRYPARAADQTTVQPLTQGQQSKIAVQSVLHTLSAGTVFQGRLVFHNLRPFELGALLWALTLGGSGSRVHGLGMGKPFGFGQVSLEPMLEDSTLDPNEPAGSAASWDDQRMADLLRAFEDGMEAWAQAHGGCWKQSTQVVNLLAMAEPDNSTRLPAGFELRHMKLETKGPNEFVEAKTKGPNEFVEAKKKGLALADYAALLGQDSRQGPKATPAAAAVRVTAGAPEPTKAATGASSTATEVLVWENATLRFDRGRGTLIAEYTQTRSAPRKGAQAQELFAALPPDQAKRLRDRGELRGVALRMERLGNQIDILGLA